MKQLRPYQQQANDAIAALYAAEKRRIVFQLATGGGKTLTASDLIFRFMNAVKKNVLFVVHREELLSQFRKAFYEQYGIIAEPITAGVKFRNPASQVYVTMVETANNRLRKSPRWFGDVGLVVIDECHIGNFAKLHTYFSRETLIVGLSATPIGASKKHPLKELYEDIVCSASIPDLIKQGALVPNKTFHIKNSVNPQHLKVTNGEFDNKEMFNEFSKFKHIENCVQGYADHAEGTKAIVFNCNVEHSKMVNEAFNRHGYNAQHLDGTMDETQRKKILKWFAETPGAILNNIGILTAGFDEPSVSTVIMNRSTKSLPLWIQCTGRGSRPFPGKEFFTIIDMGGNALTHGDWSSERSWSDLFYNPPGSKKKADGASPVKCCVECEAIIAASARVCSFCYAEQPFEGPVYDPESVEFELLDSTIDVSNIIRKNMQTGANPYRSLHQIKNFILADAKAKNTGINETIAYNLLSIYQQKVQEWCRENGKAYNEWHKNTTAGWFFDELKKQFDYEPPKLSLAV